jgi:hypothetical protein
MNLDLELITLQEEVNSLLNTAQREKRILENRKETMSIRNTSNVENVQELQAEILSAQTELAGADALIATMPEGRPKAKQIIRRKAIDLRLSRLLDSGTNLTPVEIIERQFDTNQLELMITGVDNFIAAVNARATAMDQP